MNFLDFALAVFTCGLIFGFVMVFLAQRKVWRLIAKGDKGMSAMEESLALQREALALERENHATLKEILKVLKDQAAR